MIQFEATPLETKEVVAQLSTAGLKVSHIQRRGNIVKLHLLEPSNISEEEISNIIKRGIISYRLRGLANYDTNGLKDLSPIQLDAYIDAQITDLAKAKTYLKKLSRIVLYLYKREMEEV